MYNFLRSIILLVIVLTSIVAQAKSKLESNIQSFQKQPTRANAAKIGTQLLDLSKNENWKQIALLKLKTVKKLLEVMPEKLAPELLLLTITANGIEKDTVEKNKLVRLAEKYASEKLSNKQRQSFSINLGYVHFQIGEIETAFKRLDKMRLVLETKANVDQLMNLCGLTSQTFENSGNAKQAGLFYFNCDESGLIRGSNAKGRGYFWHNYAMFLREQGDYGKAVTRHQWALNGLAAEYGLPSIQVTDAYDAMGQTLLAQGRYGAADSVATAALGQSEQLGLQGKRSHWRLVNNSAAIKRALRLPSQAMALDTSAYLWRHENLGGRDHETLVSHMNWALDLVELEKWDEAQAAMSEIQRQQTAGIRFPWDKDVIGFYLSYITAQKRHLAGKKFSISLNKTIRHGAPGDLIVGMSKLIVEAQLSYGEGKKAVEMARWLKKFVGKNIGKNRPIYFEVDLLEARAISFSSPKKGLEALKKLNIDLFNWNLGASMSGSYDAVVASRQLADDLLLLMAENALKVPKMQAYVARAFDRWRTVHGASEKLLNEVSRTSLDSKLRDLARTYLIDLARFREHVRTKTMTDEVVQLDNELKQQRKVLNQHLLKAGYSKVHPPIKSIDEVDKETPILKPGDVLVDMFLLRDWQQPDRTGYAKKMELYGAVYRYGKPVRLHLVNTIDFAAVSNDANYRKLWIDFGAWVEKHAEGAKRVFVVPDSVMFQMDLASAPVSNNRQLGEIHDLYFLTERDAFERHNIEQTLDEGDRILLAGGLYYNKQNEKAHNFLPGSLDEIDAIGAMVKEFGGSVVSLRGEEATETELKGKLPKSQIVHLATHGFFNENDEKPNSLQNAGIELSYNRNHNVPQGDDGIAFASEVMDWKLADAEIVVLSSCDSGVGNTTPVDAVRGLPLALSLAGARRSIVTLQKIPDKQTAEIMKRFYKYLTEQKLDYARAFNKTKRDIWGNRIKSVPPQVASAFVLYHH